MLLIAVHGFSMIKATLDHLIRYVVVNAIAVCGLSVSLGAVLLSAMPIRSFQREPRRIQLLNRRWQEQKARLHTCTSQSPVASAKRSPAPLQLAVTSDSECAPADDCKMRSWSSVEEDNGLFKPLSASPTSITSIDTFPDMMWLSNQPPKKSRCSCPSSVKRSKNSVESRHALGKSWMRKAAPQGSPA